ncbi:hypothetical protein L9F63_010813, partial [Diploptera punctata]
CNDTLQAPRFTMQPSPSGSIVSEGRTKILQCQAIGYPKPKYQWLKDGIALGEFSSEHFYRIHTTKREDAGSYQCVAKNDVGSIFSEKIDVSVAYMGTFEDATERDVTVEAGQAAILDLPPIESHPAPLVTWLTDGETQLYDRKYAVTDENQLVILDASVSDQKAYRAQAVNTQIGREEYSAFTRLTVTGQSPHEIAPEIVVKPKDLHIVKGQAAVDLQCIANARPLHELELVWLKDGILVENSGISSDFKDPWNRTLSLVSANLTHTGQYTCQVRLKTGGFPTVTASAMVNVLEKPSFVNSARPETLGEYGTSVTLPCEAVGVPNPNIVWFRNSERVETISGNRYNVIEDGSLQIKKLRMEDSGMFQCLAANEAGEDSIYTWLKVKKIFMRKTRWAIQKVVSMRESDLRSRSYGPYGNNKFAYAAIADFSPSGYVICRKTMNVGVSGI